MADRLQRLADVALERHAWKVLLEGAAVHHVGAAARSQRHARDCGLALARRAVARVRSEVDRCRGDRLGEDLLLLLALGLARGRSCLFLLLDRVAGLVLLSLRGTSERVDSLRHAIPLDVRAP